MLFALQTTGFSVRERRSECPKGMLETPRRGIVGTQCILTLGTGWNRSCLRSRRGANVAATHARFHKGVESKFHIKRGNFCSSGIGVTIQLVNRRLLCYKAKRVAAPYA